MGNDAPTIACQAKAPLWLLVPKLNGPPTFAAATSFSLVHW